MNIRTYTIILAGIISNLVVYYSILTPIVEIPPQHWYAVPRIPAATPADRGEWVLLPSDAHAWCLPPAFLGAYEVWRPDSGQLAQLENDLAQILPAIESVPWRHYEEDREHVPSLLSYRRQYIGVLRLGEPPVIFVNAALPDDERDRPNAHWRGWRRDMICVDDGGWGYWHLEYDPALRRFRGFGFNGSA